MKHQYQYQHQHQHQHQHRAGLAGRFFLSLALLAGLMAAAVAQPASSTVPLFSQANASAWCIVPYDSKQRGPAARIAMLTSLNFKHYAYDWRPEHLDSFAEEIRLAKANKLTISAVWMWIDGPADSVGKLSSNNQRMLSILKASGLATTVWVGFNDNFFANLDEQEKIAKGVAMVRYLRETVPTGVTGLGLYNHGDWFGEPENQVKILRVLNDAGVGIVYNFHHAHDQIARFPTLLAAMRPWLWTVNLSGLRKEGPKIMALGSGDSELEMMRELKKSGFRGSIGVLGHVSKEDVEVVLRRNLEGLRHLEQQL